MGASASVDEESAQLARQVGARIAELRRNKGWAPKDLAEHLNNSVQWVSMLESGQQNLTLHTLVRLARILDVDVKALFDEPGPEPEVVKRGRPRRG